MYSVFRCSVPYCGRSMTDKTLSFHKFPKREEFQKQWVERCRITKKLSERSYVCSAHFVKEDYIPTRGSRKLLKKIAIPSIIPLEPRGEQDLTTAHEAAQSHQFVSQKFVPAILRKHKNKQNLSEPSSDDKTTEMISEPDYEQAHDEGQRSQRTIPEEFSLHLPDVEQFDDTCQDEDNSVGSENVDGETHPIHDFPQYCNHGGNKHSGDHHHFEAAGDDGDFGDDDPDYEIGSDQATIEAIEELENAVDEIEIEGSGEISDEEIVIVRERGREFQRSSKGERLTLLDLIRNDEDLIAFTGINMKLLDSLTTIVSKCEGEGYQKRFVNTARARIVMCLCKLRLNLSFRCLAVLFGINRKTSSNNIGYMIQLLSGILEQFIIWPTREQCTRSLPKCFAKFPKTRIVLDCTEIPVEKPHCLQCRLKWYSHYKGCETVKLLMGMDPCGVITHMSEAFGGRTSDKAIFNQSGLLEKLEPTRDAVMVDKGFDIEMDCLPAHIDLIMPPKLGKRPQLSPEDSLLTNEIATARVHVERGIQRMKLWKILKDKITLTTLPYIDDIVKIIAALVNLKSPLLAADKF